MPTVHDFEARLREYYDEESIGVCFGSPEFNCLHLGACREAAGDRELVLGAEAHIGRRYGDPFRIVVVSMDTGGGAGLKRGECLEERRKNVESVVKGKANPHMNGTVELLEHILDSDSDAENVLERYAMTNAAKCAGKDDDKSRMPDPLYKNCLEYAKEELKILRPELVVTQGTLVRSVLGKTASVDRNQLESLVQDIHYPSDLPVTTWVVAVGTEYLRWWNAGDERALVLQTPHPSARQGQWQRFVRLSLPILAPLVRRLLGAADGGKAR